MLEIEEIRNMPKIEKYLFGRYKYYVQKALSIKGMGNWIAVQEFEKILNEFFEYDFSYVDNHYMVIKNEKQIYDYHVN